MLMLAPPPVPFMAFTALEIVGAPILILWQARVGRREPRSPEG
jgi:hypothetical protein